MSLNGADVFIFVTVTIFWKLPSLITFAAVVMHMNFWYCYVVTHFKWRFFCCDIWHFLHPCDATCQIELHFSTKQKKNHTRKIVWHYFLGYWCGHNDCLRLRRAGQKKRRPNEMLNEAKHEPIRMIKCAQSRRLRATTITLIII